MKLKNIIILTIVASLFFALGLYTNHKTKTANEQSTVTVANEDVFDTAEKTAVPGEAAETNINENDPLIHLKMLQKDVETFRALMEEVKNELFVTET